jgi:hypothetical protein
VYVGRPGPYGNPFALDCWGAVALGFRGDVAGRRAASAALHRWWLTGQWTPAPASPSAGGEIEYSDGTVDAIEMICRRFAAAVAEGYVIPEVRPDLAPLRGRDLACWCPLDQPCHADVLLELANR